MTDWLQANWPVVIEFFFEQGRLAVQPFLVMGGFLAAQSVHKKSIEHFWPMIGRRYMRLAPPFVMALIFVVLATLYFGNDLSASDWLSPVPNLYEFMAHVFLVHDLLGVPAISAGAWYLAIDLQLFAMFMLMQYGGRRWKLFQTYTPATIALLTLASIHLFSRDAALDLWAIYFFSAYGLGVLAFSAQVHSESKSWFFVVTALLLLDWYLDPRARPLLAMGTAWLLYKTTNASMILSSRLMAPWILFFSKISYSLFVCHFAVIVLYSGLWERLEVQGVGQALGFTWATWMTSILLGYVIHTVTARWSGQEQKNRSS